MREGENVLQEDKTGMVQGGRDKALATAGRYTE